MVDNSNMPLSERGEDSAALDQVEASKEAFDAYMTGISVMMDSNPLLQEEIDFREAQQTVINITHKVRSYLTSNRVLQFVEDNTNTTGINILNSMFLPQYPNFISTVDVGPHFLATLSLLAEIDVDSVVFKNGKFKFTNTSPLTNDFGQSLQANITINLGEKGSPHIELTYLIPGL
jgi:hypothetical protein